MDFLSCLNERVSIRGFNDQDVSKEIIDNILFSAQRAPSAGNRQPVRLKVVRNSLIKQSLYESFIHPMPWFLSSKVVIVVIVDKTRTAERYGSRGENLYCLLDAGAAIQNMLLMATNLGVGSCWIGAFDDNKVNKIFALGESSKVVSIIALGYPKEIPGTKVKRLPLEETVEYID